MEDQEYLKEGFNYKRLKKADLLFIINQHSKEVVDASLNKPQLLEMYEELIVSRREAIIHAMKNVKPSSKNIEPADDAFQPSSRRGKMGKPVQSTKPAPLTSVSLSPQGPRTRSRSRSPLRSPVRETRQSPRRRVKPIEEEGEIEQEVKAEVLKSPRKRKTKKEERPKLELKEEEEETSFSNENPFQAPDSTEFKRKRPTSDGGRASRRVSRKDVAPHKLKHSAPAQTLPENAQQVFSHAPDLQAPANLSHEPFDVSYGEPQDEEFVDQVLNLPDANELGEIAAEIELAAEAASTPASTAYAKGNTLLPSFSEIQSSVKQSMRRSADAAEQFARDLDVGFTPDPVEAAEIEAEVTQHRKELKAELEHDVEVVRTFGQRVGDKVAAAGGAVNAKATAAANAVHAKASAAGQATWRTAGRVASFDYLGVVVKILKLVGKLLKVGAFTLGVFVTITLVAFAAYTLLWLREEKIHQGYCVDGSIAAVRYPEWLYTEIHPLMDPVQEHAIQVFETLAPNCTPCPVNGKCTKYECECKETFVKQWGIESYLGVPSAPKCVVDSTKLHWLAELKRRALIILNNQRAAYECGQANVNTPEVRVSELKRELYAKRAHGMSDEVFEELFERTRSDFASGDAQFPEISVRQVLRFSPELDELTKPSAQDLLEATQEAAFSSNSFASVSLACRVRLMARHWIEQHKHQLRYIGGGFVLTAVSGLYLLHAYRRNRQLRATYDKFITVLQDVRDDADNDTTGKLKTYVLAHVLLTQAANGDERARLENMVQSHPNVRVRQLEQNSEVVRAWEWVPQ